MVQEIEKKQKKRLAKKLDYILLQEKISSHEVAKKLGYSDGATVGRWRNEKDLQQNIMLMAQEALEKHFDIPLTLWEDSLDYDPKKIDTLIEEYRNNIKSKIKIEDLSIQAKKTLQWLQGSWYSYSYSSQQHNRPHGIWIMQTTIYKNLTVTDEHGNKGYLNIRKKESYIEKSTKETEELILIRFPNHQIPYQIFLFSIQSNQMSGDPMLNFGFYARKLYKPKEAKEILGEIKRLQLKLDLEFNDRIVENYKY